MGDGDKENALFALTAPNNSKLGKKRHSKKASRQSIDLLGMNDLNNSNDKVTKKEKSEENILDFLGVSSEQKTVPNVQQKVTVFDPLQDENDNAASPGFATQKYSKYDQINNANQIKQNVVDKGNESVLNVLTGTNSKETTTKNDEFDTGTDPFAEFGDNSLNDTKSQKNKASDDPFADIGGSAFDDPIMSEPIKPKQTQNENIFSFCVCFGFIGSDIMGSSNADPPISANGSSLILFFCDFVSFNELSPNSANGSVPVSNSSFFVVVSFEFVPVNTFNTDSLPLSTTFCFI